MALDFQAIISTGTYPNKSVDLEERAAYAATYGLMGFLQLVTITDHGNGIIEIVGEVKRRILALSGHGLIKHIFWKGSAADGDKVRIEDKDNRLVWNAEAGAVTAGSVSVRDKNFDRGCNEIWVAGMDSGELTIVTDQFQER